MARRLLTPRTAGLVAAGLLAVAAAPRLIGLGASQGPDLDQSVGAKLARAAVDRTLERLESSTIPRDLEVRRSSFEDAWEVERAGYLVRTTRSPLFATWCADVMAAAQADVRMLIGAEDVKLGSTPRVWIYPSVAEYIELGDQYDELSSIYGAFYASSTAGLPVATYEETTDGAPNWNLQAFYLRYGATLQFLSQAFAGPELPLPFRQGLAAYEASRQLPDYWLDKLKSLRAASEDQWISVASLLSEETSAYADQNDPTVAGRRLVLLAGLFRYLDQHHFKGERVLASYFKALRTSREAAAAHPLTKLLTEDVEVLDGALKRFNGWGG